MTNRYTGVDPILTNLSIAYENDTYIADLLFPEVPVSKQTGQHFIYDKGRFRTVKTQRGNGSPSNEVTHGLTVGGTFFAEDHALKEFVSDDDVDNAVDKSAPYEDATENVTELLKIGKEVELATMLGDTAQMTQNTTLSGTSQWSDYTNSDPIGDVETGKQAIHAAIKKTANVMIISKQVFDKLKHHPAILDRIKWSQKGIVTTELLASIFEIEKVYIAGAGYNSAKEGQTDAMGYIWGKNCILAYIAPSAKKKVVTLGVTYRWKSRIVERLRGSSEEDRKGLYVRVGEDYYDQKLVTATAGYLIKNAVA